ncbi:hypothetical protein B0H14DRAFT_3494963 [Mycena olivaceomarginata]|nr:hypothetical protein B0H14DRAFT_3494963 [Mycena olivaceomarginata]
MAKYLAHLSFTLTTTTPASTPLSRRLQSLKPTALASTSTTSILQDVPAHILQRLTNNLGYIQDMGFNTVWILPIVKNINRHCVRRWLPRASTILSSPLLCLHFSPSTKLKKLSEVLLLRGMYFMAWRQMNRPMPCAILALLTP